MYFTENAQMYTYNVGWFSVANTMSTLGGKFGFLEEVSAIVKRSFLAISFFDAIDLVIFEFRRRFDADSNRFRR